MRFTKMEGLGNDYICLNCLEAQPRNLPELARRLSNRRLGVGGDGLICIFPSRAADAKMRIFNADGSEAEMCGNGIRCFGKYLWDKKLVVKRELTVETGAGIRALTLHVYNGQVNGATVDMGIPEIDAVFEFSIDEKGYPITPVSVGNPHAVVFCPEPDSLDLSRLGPEIEHHPAFPNRTNVEFVQVLGKEQLYLRVWERGSGETSACGTGACAALAAAAAAGLTQREADVSLPGGVLRISWSAPDEHLFMTGPAKTVFEGEL